MIWAVLLGVVVLALAAGLMLSARLVSRRPVLAQVAVEGAYLAVRPRGMIKILAFRGKLLLDRTAIRHVAVIDRTGIPRLGMRLHGTGTKNLQAGKFATDNQTGIVFMLVGCGQRFLRVDLGSGKIRYLVIQVSDPDQAAAELTAASRH